MNQGQDRRQFTKTYAVARASLLLPVTLRAADTHAFQVRAAAGSDSIRFECRNRSPSANPLPAVFGAEVGPTAIR